MPFLVSLVESRHAGGEQNLVIIVLLMDSIGALPRCGARPIVMHSTQMSHALTTPVGGEVAVAFYYHKEVVWVIVGHSGCFPEARNKNAHFGWISVLLKDLPRFLNLFVAVHCFIAEVQF